MKPSESLKKVIVICHNYEPSQAPSEPDLQNRFYTYGFGGNTGKNLKKFRNDYEVEVWRLDGYVKKYYETNIFGVHYRVFPSIHRKNIFDFSLKFLLELRKEVNRTNPILLIIHTHYCVAYQIAFLFRKSKIVSTHHGEWSPFFRFSNTKGLRKLKALIDMQIEKVVFKNIDYILTCEKRQVPYIRKANPNIRCALRSTGISFDNIKLISKDDARRMLRLEHDKKYILYVGKLYKFKQVDELIRTWLEIKKERPEVELVIVGNAVDDKWEEFYNFALESGAKLMGRILNTEIYKYYCAADVYVQFGLHKENFGGTGIAPLESLACNTPVVSSTLINYIGGNVNELGEIPDSIEKYKGAILKVLDNPGDYMNMRESIKKHYDLEVVYKSIAKILDELFTVPKGKI